MLETPRLDATGEGAYDLVFNASGSPPIAFVTGGDQNVEVLTDRINLGSELSNKAPAA